MKDKAFVRCYYSIAILLLLLSGCSKNVPDKTAVILPTNSKQNTISTIEPTPSILAKSTINEFSILVGEKYISLEDWDYDIDISSTLGEPLQETQEILGDGADTHSGSIVKTQEFEGLVLYLFSPKQNGKEFWIMQMVVNDGRYKTYRGISIGCTSDQFKQSYPEAIMALDGRTDSNNCAYTFNQDELYIIFEIGDGVIKDIKYYKEIQ